MPVSLYTLGNLMRAVVKHISSPTVTVASYSLYIIGALMRLFPEIYVDTSCFKDMVEVVYVNRSNQSVVDNGLNAIMSLLVRSEENFVCYNDKSFLNMIRSLLNSEKHDIQKSSLEFLMLLTEKDTTGCFISAFCEYGNLEFLFELLSCRKPFLRELNYCLLNWSSHPSFDKAFNIPHYVWKILCVIEELLRNDIALASKYCQLLFLYINNYKGKLDFFLSPTVQQKFLDVILSLIQLKSVRDHFLALALIEASIRNDRFSKSIFTPHFLEILKSFKSKIHLFLPATKFDITREIHDRRSTCKYAFRHVISLLIEFFYELHRAFMMQLVSDMQETLTDCFWRALIELFFGKYLESLLVDKLPTVIQQKFLWMTSIYTSYTSIHGDPGVHRPHESILKQVIGNCFYCIFPLFFRIILSIPNESGLEDGKIHLSDIQSTIGAMENNGSTSFISRKYPLKIHVLALLILNGMPEYFSHPFPSENVVQEISAAFSYLVEGVQYVKSIEYEYLSTLISDECGKDNGISKLITALCLICVLVRRALLSHEPGQNGYLLSVTRFSYTASERMIKLLLVTIVQCGNALFDVVPNLFISQLITTYATVQHLFQAIDLSSEHRETLVSQGWNILGRVMLHKLTPYQTYILLQYPGIEVPLQRPDPIWIKLAQKLILQCHTDDVLYEQKLFKRLPVSYIFLSHIWTVWLSVFTGIGNLVVLQRLTKTFCNTLNAVRETSEDPSDPKEDRCQFIHYLVDSFHSAAMHMSCPLTEFFLTADAFLQVYVCVLESVVELFDELSMDPAKSLRWFQGVLDIILMKIDTEAFQSIKHRLLRLILRCLVIAKGPLLIQLTKVLLAAMDDPELSQYFLLEDISNLEQCRLFRLPSDVIELIMCIGAILAGCVTTALDNQLDVLREEATYANPNLMLILLQDQLANRVSSLTQTAVMQCALHSFDTTAVNNLWPDCEESGSAEFYFQLCLSLYTMILDPLDHFKRSTAIKLYTAVLQHANATEKSRHSIGDDLLASYWNEILFEQLREGAFFTVNQSPSVHFIDLLTGFIQLNSPLIFAFVERRVIVDLLLYYIQSDEEQLDENLSHSLQQYALKLSKSPKLRLLSRADAVCIQAKINRESQRGPAPSLLDNFCTFLLEK